MRNKWINRKFNCRWAAIAAAIFFVFFAVRTTFAQDSNVSIPDQGQIAPHVTQPAQLAELGQPNVSTTVQEQAAAQPAAAEEDSEELNRLFADASRESAVMDREAEELRSYHPTETSRESHGEQLNIIRDHVNQLGKLEGEMRDERENGSAWQQHTVDQLRPMLEELAGNMEETIAEFNTAHPPVEFNARFRTLINENAKLATQLHRLVRDAVRYGHAKRNFERLHRRLHAQQ